MLKCSFLSEASIYELNKPQNLRIAQLFLITDHFSQRNLSSVGIERSDELLLIAINDRLLLRKLICNFLTTCCLIAQYKIY